MPQFESITRRAIKQEYWIWFQCNRATRARRLRATQLPATGPAQMRKIENEALAEFSEALKLEPRNVNIVLGRAACYMLTRQFDPALADIDQALEIEPNNGRSSIVFFSGAPPGCW